MNIRVLIDQSAQHLSLITKTPRLEAELLLSHLLEKDRAYLYTYPDDCLTNHQKAHFEMLLRQRLTGKPMAYVLGKKPFWSFELEVTAETLIPRPETELLVSLALQQMPEHKKASALDLGTGSGAIALALSLERPTWRIMASDISKEALKVARANAIRLNCPIEFYQGAWFAALPHHQYAVIVSNPPYIAYNDQDIEPFVVEFEPNAALFSGEDGLDAICHIVTEAGAYLETGGWLLLEHGAFQAAEVTALLKQNHYAQVSTHADLSGKPRVTVGQFIY